MENDELKKYIDEKFKTMEVAIGHDLRAIEKIADSRIGEILRIQIEMQVKIFAISQRVFFLLKKFEVNDEFVDYLYEKGMTDDSL